MTLTQEAIRSIRAVLRLVRLDESALADFNISRDGFWRAYFAAVIILPLVIGWIYFEYRFSENIRAVGLPRVLLISAIAYVLSWTLWPLIMFYLTKRIDCGDRFLHYIVVYFWAQVPIYALYTAISFGIAPFLGGFGPDIVLAAFAATVLFEWWLTMKTLQVTALSALLIEAGAVVFVIVLGRAEKFVLFAGNVPGS